MRHNLSHGLRELSAEQGQDRNDAVNQDAENEIPVPTQLARLGAVQTAQIPIHLNEDPHCDPDERKNGGPVEKQQEIMGPATRQTWPGSRNKPTEPESGLAKPNQVSAKRESDCGSACMRLAGATIASVAAEGAFVARGSRSAGLRATEPC